MSNSFERPPSPLGVEGTDEEKGKKPILKVIISRHGPKLTAAGEKNAKAAYFDDEVKAGFRRMGISEENEGLVRIATSPVKRAVDTADIQLNELKKSKHRTKDYVPNKNELAVPFQPENEVRDKRFSDDLDTIVNMQKELEPNVRTEVEQELASVPEEEREAEIRNRIDMAVLSDLFADEERTGKERRFKTSWEELADGFAKRYAGFSRHSGMLEKARGEGSRQPNDEPYIQVGMLPTIFSLSAFIETLGLTHVELPLGSRAPAPERENYSKIRRTYFLIT